MIEHILAILSFLFIGEIIGVTTVYALLVFSPRSSWSVRVGRVTVWACRMRRDE